MDQCPSCGRARAGQDAECSGCGLIFAKWRLPEARPAPPAEAAGASVSPLFLVLLAAAAGGGWWSYQRYLTLAAGVEEAAAPLPWAWPPEVGQAYPELRLLDDQGREVSLSSFKGKVILVETAGMTCPACNAFAGANKLGGFGGVTPQADLAELETYVRQFAGGDWLSSPEVVFVQLLLTGPDTSRAPTVAELARWRDHFQLRGRFPGIVLLAGDPRMVAEGYKLVPGFQLIDRDFILRYSSAGHRAPHDLYRDVLPRLGLLASGRG